MKILRVLGLAVIAATALGQSAFAGIAPAPGPIAGIGLPAVAIIGGAYWLGRKLFSRKDQPPR